MIERYQVLAMAVLAQTKRDIKYLEIRAKRKAPTNNKRACADKRLNDDINSFVSGKRRWWFDLLCEHCELDPEVVFEGLFDTGKPKRFNPYERPSNSYHNYNTYILNLVDGALKRVETRMCAAGHILDTVDNSKVILRRSVPWEKWGLHG